MKILPLGIALTALTGLSTLPANAPQQAKENGTGSAQAELDLTRLDAIVPLSAPFEKVEGSPSYKSLEDFFLENNQTIYKSFSSHATNASQTSVDLFFVTAPAQSGKSTFLRFLQKRHPGQTAFMSVDKLDQLNLETRQLPDLKSNLGTPPVTLSEMVALKHSRVIPFPDLLKAFSINAEAPCIIVDSLDEVHPSTTLTILRSIEDFVAARNAQVPSEPAF